MNGKIWKIIRTINVTLIVLIILFLVYSFIKRNTDVDEYIQFRGYKFKTSDTVSFEMLDNEILIASADNVWSSKIVMLDDPNNYVFGNVDKMYDLLIYRGYDTSAPTVHTINNSQYITFEMRMGEESAISSVLFGYYKVNDTRICEIVLTDNKISYNYEAFKQIAKIFENAEYDIEEDKKYHYWALNLDSAFEKMAEIEQNKVVGE